MTIRHYLKSSILLLCTWLGVFLLLWVSFNLYGLPSSAVGYPMGLCGLILLGYLAVDYRRTVVDLQQRQAIARQLDALQQELEAANAKSAQRMEYYSIWAYQIKTPIAALQLQLQDNDSPLSRSIQVEVQRISTYVDMAMTYLRLDSDTTDYVFETCSLDEIVHAAVRSFAGEFISRKISLDYTPVQLQVLTDRKWLTFVVQQLLSNALKYTSEGAISIRVVEGNTLCIGDTGMGIAAEDLPRIFDRGFTGYNGRRQQKASGLGLYLCKRICDGLGHKISVSSTMGQGTTASICFLR